MSTTEIPRWNAVRMVDGQAVDETCLSGNESMALLIARAVTVFRSRISNECPEVDPSEVDIIPINDSARDRLEQWNLEEEQKAYDDKINSEVPDETEPKWVAIVNLRPRSDFSGHYRTMGDLQAAAVEACDPEEGETVEVEPSNKSAERALIVLQRHEEEELKKFRAKRQSQVLVAKGQPDMSDSEVLKIIAVSILGPVEYDRITREKEYPNARLLGACEAHVSRLSRSMEIIKEALDSFV